MILQSVKVNTKEKADKIQELLTKQNRVCNVLQFYINNQSTGEYELIDRYFYIYYFPYKIKKKVVDNRKIK